MLLDEAYKKIGDNTPVAILAGNIVGYHGEGDKQGLLKMLANRRKWPIESDLPETIDEAFIVVISCLK